MTVYSHPNKPLEKHVQEIIDIASHYGIVDDTFKEIAFWHDIGKQHPDFQKALQEKQKPPIYHAQLSAAAILSEMYKVAQQYRKTQQYKQREDYITLFKKYLLLFFWVKHHHTGFRLRPQDKIEEEKNFFELSYSRFMSQNINWNMWLEDIGITALSEEQIKYVKDKLIRILFFFSTNEEDNEEGYNDYTEKFYWYFRKQLATLVRADRLSAGNMWNIEDNINLPPAILEKALAQIDKLYPIQVSKNNESLIVTYRKQSAQKVMLAYKQSVNAPYGHFAFSAPTGAGKTAIAFRLAIEHAKNFGLKRIIYVVPFINVNRQVSQIARQLFGDKWVLEDHSQIFTDEEIEIKELEELDEKGQKKQEQYILQRIWTKPVIITTMAYFWDIIFGKSTTDMINMPLLQDSVIIFDEIQALPVEYWKDLTYTMNQLQKNNFIISFSATYPQSRNKSGRVFHDNVVILEPLPKDRYTVQIEYLTENTDEANNADYPISTTEVNYISEIIKQYNNIATIVNTRKASVLLYQYLKNKGENVLLLNTYLPPCIRQNVIKEVINRQKQNTTVKLITTQIIEAGVDLDFDIVIREIAPLDSLIQAAGRTGRHGTRQGKMIILSSQSDYKENNLLRRAITVYGTTAIKQTQQILSQTVYTEQNFVDLQPIYYESFVSEKPLQKNLLLIQSFKYHELKHFINNYIDKNVWTYIFIPKGKEDYLRELYEQTLTNQRLLKKRAWKILSQYIGVLPSINEDTTKIDRNAEIQEIIKQYLSQWGEVIDFTIWGNML